MDRFDDNDVGDDTSVENYMIEVTNNKDIS